ncbi:MAG: 1-deoxy-D-xylulose-5-phosphate reductoisomerase, partial [Clostridiales bacterium]
QKQLEAVTPEMALRHPNWQMGRKITVDCATMVNKGLEIIEAHHLFQTPYKGIEALIHPQSIIHSLVVFRDGSIKAQLAKPDMRLPIQYALLYPQRPACSEPPLDLVAAAGLTFYPVDQERFPAVYLAKLAGESGGAAPAVFNRANEILVELFLQQRISFTEISSDLERVLDAYPGGSADDLTQVLYWNDWTGRKVRELRGEFIS